MSDDELFANHDDEMIDINNQDENIMEQECNDMQATREDSDVDPDDYYGDEDFFGKNNGIYNKTTPFSKIDPPSHNAINNPNFQK